ncbi:hypothetical protein ACOSP7_021840 [Xanthoceras sorbifolium]|uniref:Uncharacterized protein n=1 Tax=Xanthoceras sorbifolium TaxID=99658 RepID=A0ABQ8HN74_9ROSI|nr:hypothetical protein JRO89_XS08G0017200 [Xanthoceras sorbifolium]
MDYNLTVPSSISVMTITCTMDWLLWPISKDALIIRIGQRCVVFGMLALLYGLRFPLHYEEEKMKRVFMKFGHYHDFDLRKSIGDPKFWKNLLPSIEAIVHNKLSQFGHYLGKSPSDVENQDSGRVRVFQTSSSTKLVREAILSGSLKSNHIEIQDMRPK